ncbi:unnamed protein product [Rhizoctonia solani]|uniref:Peptidase C14 caspase domain-containing protein n=1 Tax=Rhizoctonia solani TaxID=456999 RepID=A0A8H2W7G5_9AGAM|nr:unnamed protein product [Rhizoctonia solani]
MEEYSYSLGYDPVVEGSASQARGPIDKPGSLQSNTINGQVDESTAKGLNNAILAGDYSSADLCSKVERRALLVAVQYLTGAWNLPKLLSTPNDVWHIYGKRGYEPSGIRILVEGIIDDERCNPTKPNIMEGLKWLVKGARSSDYRYFHFSGHGIAFETERIVGKIARKIPQNFSPISLDDTERLTSRSNLSSVRNETISSQNIKEDELKYYNEALVTAYRMPLHKIVGPVERDDWNRIRDSDLNALFSELPKECTLTTSLDCCHSGRMINNNFKLRGSGFRGGIVGSTERYVVQETLSQLINQDSNGIATRNHTTISNGSTDGQTLAIEVQAPPNSDDSQESRSEEPNARRIGKGYLTLSTPARNYFLPLRINMREKLPAEEANRDNIQASIMAWSGCHQRQVATDHNSSLGGYFTWAFTSAISDLQASGTPTVRELHEEVDKRLREAVGNRRL